MRDIQEIFNLIIDNGLYVKYAPDDDEVYMCDMLDRAYSKLLISSDERHHVKDAIDEYIKGAFSLRGMLKRNNLPHDYEARKAIYQDWVNRPELTVQPDGYWD